MTNQRETWRSLLEELRDAAEFDEVLLPAEQGIAGDDAADADPLRAVLDRRGVRSRLARIAGELLPYDQRVHLDVDPLEVGPLMLCDGHLLARRRAFAACMAEMLRRLDFGYSARPPLPDQVFPGGSDLLAARAADVSSSVSEGAVAGAIAEAKASDFRRRFDEATAKANWCAGLAAWNAALANKSVQAPAPTDPTAAPAAAALPADAPASATAPSAHPVVPAGEMEAAVATPVAKKHDPAALAAGWVVQGLSAAEIARRLGLKRRQDLYEKPEWKPTLHMLNTRKDARRQARADRRKRCAGQNPDSEEI
ncbi:MAG: hypothetical protein INH34_03555 [Phycisphaerales bacterium]|nr:hypothetical protein [Phycisphaerales bacterium]